MEIRNHPSGAPTLCYDGEGHMSRYDSASAGFSSPESKTCSMCVSTIYGNRESSAVVGGVSVVSPAGEGRRPQFQYERCPVVGQAHSTWEAIEQRSFNLQLILRGLAEMVEGRSLTEGNPI